jgi:hypothetical protein
MTGSAGGALEDWIQTVLKSAVLGAQSARYSEDQSELVEKWAHSLPGAAEFIL